jgi:hypothetical protein
MSLAGAGLGPSAAGHIRGSAHFRQNEKVHQKDRVGDGKGHETAATARLELQKNLCHAAKSASGKLWHLVLAIKISILCKNGRY